MKTPKEKPRCDTGEESAGFQPLADWGLGASAKLAHQFKIELNVPKFFRLGADHYVNFYSSDC
jgi:hypothetical protein